MVVNAIFVIPVSLVICVIRTSGQEEKSAYQKLKTSIHLKCSNEHKVGQNLMNTRVLRSFVICVI